jgi:hypothetical protein
MSYFSVQISAVTSLSVINIARRARMGSLMLFFLFTFFHVWNNEESGVLLRGRDIIVVIVFLHGCFLKMKSIDTNPMSLECMSCSTSSSSLGKKYYRICFEMLHYYNG